MPLNATELLPLPMVVALLLPGVLPGVSKLKALAVLPSPMAKAWLRTPLAKAWVRMVAAGMMTVTGGTENVAPGLGPGLPFARAKLPAPSASE